MTDSVLDAAESDTVESDTVESDTAEFETDETDGRPRWRWSPGFPLPGAFQAWERLGVGTRCETWLVWSTGLWCPAVVKLARPDQLTHPRARLALDREVAALRATVHPALPRLIEDGTAAELPYVAVEYVDGPTLADEIDDAGPLFEVDAAVLGLQLLAALHVLHGRGLAHLDVKPDNVVLCDGRPVLIDFGSARAIGSPQPAGRPVGTVGYAAPEMEACAPVDAAMDLYSLGATLREAVTGEPPGTDRRCPAGALAELLDALHAPAPDRPDEAATLAALLAIIPARYRSWPEWLSVPCGQTEGTGTIVRSIAGQ